MNFLGLGQPKDRHSARRRSDGSERLPFQSLLEGRLPFQSLLEGRLPFQSLLQGRLTFESSLEGLIPDWARTVFSEAGKKMKKHTRALMRSEDNRLQSFQQWPTSLPISAEEFARAGFFYMGSGNEVQCFSCGGVLESWALGENPMEMHKRFFPDCLFVLDREEKNCPLAPEGCRCPDYTDGRILGQLTWMETGDSSLLLYPAHPEKELERTRLSSFRYWPMDVEVQPQQLARAGFFYTGHGDCVTCFYCDGTIRNWEEHNDPWTEHAKWLPTCSFLQHSLGPDFINQLQEYTFGSAECPDEPETPEHRSSQDSEFESWYLTPECRSDSVVEGNTGESAEEQLQRLQEERMCKICMDNQVCIVFIPCGHLVCEECAPSLKECPICRAHIQDRVRTFMS